MGESINKSILLYNLTRAIQLVGDNTMTDEYYPWGGDFITCNNHGSVAVVLLNIDFTPSEKVAIYGRLKTENIGIEKIVANVISNPHIRYLVLCGNDIRGHRSGRSLIALHNNGIDKNHRILHAPGAIPYIENLDEKALKRFQDQITIIDMIDITDQDRIHNKIETYIKKSSNPFGEPFIALCIKENKNQKIQDKRALHSKVILDYMGKVKKRE